MRRAYRASLIALSLACAPAIADEVPGAPGAKKSSAHERAARRAYDGAPPVIPHANLGGDCTACHNARGVAVPGLGFAPPSPHEDTKGIGATARCRQCHVFRETEAEFKPSHFVGFAQDLRRGARLNAAAPPVMPHPVFMRENCHACHDGPAAREPIRTPHPDRVRCPQCHVEQRTRAEFAR